MSDDEDYDEEDDELTQSENEEDQLWSIRNEKPAPEWCGKHTKFAADEDEESEYKESIDVKELEEGLSAMSTKN